MIRACYIAATVLPLCHAVALSPQAPSYLTQVDIGAPNKNNGDKKKVSNNSGGADLPTMPPSMSRPAQRDSFDGGLPPLVPSLRPRRQSNTGFYGANAGAVGNDIGPLQSSRDFAEEMRAYEPGLIGGEELPTATIPTRAVVAEGRNRD